MAKLSFGEFMSVLRKAKGLTQEDVASKLDVSPKSVSAWENNRTYPDILLLPAIADLYGVTVDELVRGEKSNPEKETEEHANTMSNEAMLKLRKRKYASFNGRSTSFTLSAVGCSLVAVMGALLATFTSLWTMVFAILGILGTATFIILSWNNGRRYLVSEGIVFDDDVTAESKPMVLYTRTRWLKAMIFSAIPLLSFGLIFTFVLAFSPDALIYESNMADISLTVNLRGKAIAFCVIYLLLGIVLSALGQILQIRPIHRFGTEKQIKNDKRNRIVSIIYPIMFIVLFRVTAYIVTPAFNSEVLDPYSPWFDTFEEFRDFMQTYHVSEYDTGLIAAGFEVGQEITLHPEDENNECFYTTWVNIEEEGETIGKYILVSENEEDYYPIYSNKLQIEMLSDGFALSNSLNATGEGSSDDICVLWYIGDNFDNPEKWVYVRRIYNCSTFGADFRSSIYIYHEGSGGNVFNIRGLLVSDKDGLHYQPVTVSTGFMGSEILTSVKPMYNSGKYGIYYYREYVNPDEVLESFAKFLIYCVLIICNSFANIFRKRQDFRFKM